MTGAEGIQVEPESLVRAGKKMQEAAGGVSKASPHDEFGPIPGSLPGSQIAVAAKALGDAWLDAFADLKRDAEDFGENMIEVGRRYRQMDQHSGQEAHRLDRMVAGSSPAGGHGESGGGGQPDLHHRLGGGAR